MKSRFILWIGISLCFIPSAIQAQEIASPLGQISSRTGLLIKDDIITRLILTSSGDRAFDFVSQITHWNREQASEGYSMAAEYVSQKIKEFGLEQVKIEEFPVDGKTEYFGNTMYPEWKVKKGELWLTSPFRMKLASYDDLPMSLVKGSTSANLEAELVDIGAGKSEQDFSAGVKAKIVLTTSNPLEIYERAVLKEGAAGIVSSWSVPDFDYPNRRPGDFPDQVGWSQLPPKGAEDSNHFAFLMSSRRAQELRVLMQQGKKLRAQVDVSAELVPGKFEIVSCIIPGSLYPNEEIIVTAHLDHYKPGANDNASGSASILEMAKTLREMIDNEFLTPPLRTIRFMWVPEYNGTYAWLSTHLNDPVLRIANLNFDMVGENLLKTNSVPGLSYTSDSNPSFLNGLLESIMDFVNNFNGERYPPQMDMYIGSQSGSRNRVTYRMEPYITGTDHELFNTLKIGATTLVCWPDNFYHSSEDTPDKVDPTQLHRAVVIGLAAIVTLAYSDNEQAKDLAWLSLLYGRKRIAGSEFTAVRSLLASNRDDFCDKDYLSRIQIAHVYQRERAAIGSSTVFARTKQARSYVERAVALLNDDEAASRNRVENVAVQMSTVLGISRATKTLTEAERLAARLIPAPIKGKELFNMAYVSRTLAVDTAAQIPKITMALDEAARLLRAKGEGELRMFGLPDAPASYADGKRSILDIRDAVAAEYVSIPVEALELYFRAFERAGLMTIREK